MSDQMNHAARLFVLPLPMHLRRIDVEDLFGKYGEIVDIKMMRGYGFVEFRDPADAQKALDELNGREFSGETLKIEFSKPRKPREDRPRREDRPAREPRLKATHRVQVSNLSSDVSWQDLKDFVRGADVEVAFTDVSRRRDGSGVVDFTSKEDMDKVLGELNNKEFKGAEVRLEEDPAGPPEPRTFERRGPRDRFDDRGDRYRGGYDRGDRYGDRGDRGDRYDRYDRGGRGRDSRDRYDGGRDRGDRYGGRDRGDRYDGGRDRRDRYDGGRDRRGSSRFERERSRSPPRNYDRDLRDRSPPRYDRSPRYDRGQSPARSPAPRSPAPRSPAPRSPVAAAAPAAAPKSPAHDEPAW